MKTAMDWFDVTYKPELADAKVMASLDEQHFFEPVGEKTTDDSRSLLTFEAGPLN